MAIEAMGYVGIRAKSLEDWAGFGEKFLGMQLVDKSRGSLAFRMDDRKQRVAHHPGRRRRVAFGWKSRMPPRSTPQARLRSAGCSRPRTRARRRTARRRSDCVRRSGRQPVEIFHGAETTSEPFKPAAASRLPHGPLGMDTRCCMSSTSTT
jgi:hypothetical protein